mmetsp:Transcript_17987/g.44917  ORF Transcript_17987/g.44917 Transcript_17987/m.44917 type:complete len:208 (-) Transcript_17987:86-709(-)
MASSSRLSECSSTSASKSSFSLSLFPPVKTTAASLASADDAADVDVAAVVFATFTGLSAADTPFRAPSGRFLVDEGMLISSSPADEDDPASLFCSEKLCSCSAGGALGRSNGAFFSDATSSCGGDGGSASKSVGGSLLPRSLSKNDPPCGTTASTSSPARASLGSFEAAGADGSLSGFSSRCDFSPSSKNHFWSYLRESTAWRRRSR